MKELLKLFVQVMMLPLTIVFGRSEWREREFYRRNTRRVGNE